MNIKALYCGKLNPPQAIFSQNFQPKNKSLAVDLAKLGTKIRALNSKAGERDKLKTQYGIWFVMHLKGNAYGLCTSQTYSQRFAYKLLNELQAFIAKQSPQIKKLSTFAINLCNKMQDPSKFDKLAGAQQQVNMLQGQINVGIRKVLKKQEQLQQLGEHAIQLKSLASEFATNAEKVESISFWKKWKPIFLIAAIILGFISIVVLTIMMRS